MSELQPMQLAGCIYDNFADDEEVSYDYDAGLHSLQRHWDYNAIGIRG